MSIKEKKYIYKSRSNVDYQFLSINKFLPFIFYGFFLFFLYLVFKIYSSTIYAISTACVLYIIFKKPYLLLYKKFPYRTLTPAFAAIVITLIIAIPIVVSIAALVFELNRAHEAFQVWATKENIASLYQQYTWLPNLLSTVDIDLQTMILDLNKTSSFLFNHFLSEGKEALGTLVTALSNGLLGLLVLFFLFKDGSRFKVLFYRALPFPYQLKHSVGDSIINSIEIILKGTLIIAILQGVAVGVLFAIFGLSLPLLYGVLSALVSLIPIIGTAFVWLPVALYLYFVGHVWASILFVTLCYSAYLILENIVKPWLLDSRLPYHVHPFLLFLAIIGGIVEFGLKGFVLGPLIVVIFVILWELIYLFNGKNETRFRNSLNKRATKLHNSLSKDEAK